MRFSVVVPVYNVEDYLSDCLDSILAQTFPDYEIVLIDDGSTDGSSAICERYSRLNNNIRYYTQKNHGLFATRRRGAQLARGEYLVALDSDDALHKDALLLINDAINSTGAQVICFDMARQSDFMIERAYDESNSRATLLSKRDVKRSICSSPKLNTICGKAIEINVMRRCYHNLDGELRLSMGEDLFQSLRLIDIADSFCQVEVAIYYYRINRNSITKLYRRDNTLDSEYVYSGLMAYAKKWQKDELGECDYEALAASTVICAFGALGQSAVETMPCNDALQELGFIANSKVLNCAASLFSMNSCHYRFDKVILGKLLIKRNYSVLLKFVRMKNGIKKIISMLECKEGDR